ncbi:fibrous sheath-interacting protein 2 isoform X2 [Callithrix jacchus]
MIEEILTFQAKVQLFQLRNHPQEIYPDFHRHFWILQKKRRQILIIMENQPRDQAISTNQMTLEDNVQLDFVLLLSS